MRHRLRLPPLGQSLLAGAVSALALPPVNALPALFAYGWLVILLLQATTWRRTWMLAVAFVFAQAATGLHWIAIAFTVDAERFGALAIPAVVLLCLGIALIQGSVVSLFGLRTWRSPLAAVLAFVPLWLAGEWLRGWIGQFPWNLVGYTLADWSWLAQGAALGSVWWLGWIALLLGTLPALWWRGAAGARLWTGTVVAGLVTLALFGLARLQAPVALTDIRLRIVQGAFALDHNFEAGRLRDWFFDQVRWSLEPAAVPLDAILWSEGASPYPLDADADARRILGEMLVRQNVTPWLLTGGDRLVRSVDGSLEGVTNSLFALDAHGVVAARYDKVDLVPFGEFMPFRGVLGRLGLRKLTAGTIDYVRGRGRRTLNLEGLPPFSPLICYEAIFVGRVQAGQRPDWLLNVTIDTWFGDSLGPHQHLAMARLRAIEEGLPLIRVANSGISASIDAYGRILERMGLDDVGVMDVWLPSSVESTLFSRNSGLLIWLSLGSTSVLGAVIETRTRRRNP
ncbi:MAG: apolipoprotein N-acyltransferase [Pseudomonadota bacterium]